MVRSGKFWMAFWLVTLGVILTWGGLTLALWMDSVANLNMLSIAALVLAVGAGLQSTLAMRKADRRDSF